MARKGRGDRRGFDSLVQTAMGFNHAEGEAAGDGKPKPLPMQILDEATGYLIAFGAAAALWRRQQQEGGSWHVQVSLAQTGQWLRGSAACRRALDRQARPRPYVETSASGFGELAALRHSAQLSRTPAAWPRPSMPPGSHPPVWPITSGRVVACDPLVQPERQPFARELQARGAFPVETLHDNGRIALAVLWLRERAEVRAADLRWEMALIEGDLPDTLGDDEFFGYPVDAGVGCFMDADAATAMAERDRREAENPDYVSYYDDVISAEMGDADTADHWPLGPGSANNTVIFRSGWGDGSYPSFWALDAAGEPVALVTDFMTITGGDARDENDKRGDAYKASLSPEKLAALEALGAAAVSGDTAAIGPLLAAGVAGTNEIVPSLGETALMSAYSLPRLCVEGLVELLEKASAPVAKAGFLKRLFS
jgi:hypothetical protein